MTSPLKQPYNSAPKVSVILPTYNRPKMLAEALRSIQCQTLRPFEVVVVNDGGADVNPVLARMSKRMNIIYLQHGYKKGPAAARNTGLRAALGEYIAYLDDDDIYYPHHLETLATCLAASDGQVAYSDAYRARQTRSDGLYLTVTRDVPYSREFDYDRILISNYVPVLCVMHERSCVNKAGYFDETLPALEDWDFLIRVSRHYSMSHCRKLTCEFRWREDESTFAGSKTADTLRAMKMIYDKHRCQGASKPYVLLSQLLNLEYFRLCSYVHYSFLHVAMNVLRRRYQSKQVPEIHYWG